MAYRDSLATTMLNSARLTGRYLGCELVVETSSHSIKTTMEVPDKDSRAWDPHQFKSGQMYVRGYANPIKPTVRQHTELEEPDTVDAEESGEADTEAETDDTEEHVQLISSPRYQSYMRQELISQLLNPRAQWKLIVYAVIGLAGLMLINVLVSLSNAGVL